MGKPTGFMEYDREDARAIEPKERIKNFNEFHIPLSKERQQIQGALHELRRAVLPGGNEHHGDDLGMPAAQPGSGVE